MPDFLKAALALLAITSIMQLGGCLPKSTIDELRKYECSDEQHEKVILEIRSCGQEQYACYAASVMFNCSKKDGTVVH